MSQVQSMLINYTQPGVKYVGIARNK